MAAVKYIVRQCKEMSNQSALLISFLLFLLFTTSNLVASIILDIAVLVFAGCFLGLSDILEPALYNEMRPSPPPHVCTRVRTPLLPCAVKRLYLFSQSSLIMYSPRALKRVIRQYMPLFTHTGLIFLTLMPPCVRILHTMSPYR
jgi:hypothetical protein